MSSPIAIPSTSRAPSSYANAIASSSLSSSSSSSLDVAPKLYVPVHRRNRDSDGASAAGSFSSRFSLADLDVFSTPSSISSDIFSTGFSMSSARTTPDVVSQRRPSAPGVYSIEELINLADSPLAKLAPAVRSAMRDAAPDIVLCRRKAETKRWRSRQDRQEEHQRRRGGRMQSSQSPEGRRRPSWSSEEERW